MLSQNATLTVNPSTEKTRRSSNFSSKEVKFLIQLVDNRKDVIESKKTDRAASEGKVKAWLEIEEEFNATFDDYRSFKVLKTKYENLKKNVKRKLPTNISNLNVLKIMQTGECGLTNEPLSEFEYASDDENTLHTSSDVDMKPQPPLNEQELDAAAEEYVFETLLFGAAPQSFSPTETQKPSPKPPFPEHSKQQTFASSSKAEKKISTVDVWEQVAHKKLKKLDLEINVIEEEWKLKKIKLELETESIRIENRFKEEKLKLELELLKQNLTNHNNNNNSS